MEFKNWLEHDEEYEYSIQQLQQRIWSDAPSTLVRPYSAGVTDIKPNIIFQSNSLYHKFWKLKASTEDRTQFFLLPIKYSASEL